MLVTKEKNNGSLLVTISGHLDTNTAPQLEAEINPELAGVTDLKLEIKDLEYISSAGLRVLLMLHKAVTVMGGQFTVLHPCDEVMEILDMTGFSSFLNIEE